MNILCISLQIFSDQSAECISAEEWDLIPINVSLGYDTKLHLRESLQSWSSGEWEVFLHCHYSQVPSDLEKFLSMGRIELFNYLTVCKRLMLN